MILEAVRVHLRKAKPESNSKALRGKSVDVRASVTVVLEQGETKMDDKRRRKIESQQMGPTPKEG